MGNARNNETRDRILEAAMELFRSKGLNGMSMRDLAEQAGVNKGLLHYYFKTKDVLFREVFLRQVTALYREVSVLLDGTGPLRDKVPEIVERYFNLLGQVPGLPAFVLFEAQRNPDLIAASPVRDILFGVMMAAERDMQARPLPPERASGLQFILDIVALCAFTFAVLPVISKTLKMNKTAQKAFLAARKAHIIAVVQHSLKP
jgi:TetR/AcrR family transcriptional regulator